MHNGLRHSKIYVLYSQQMQSSQFKKSNSKSNSENDAERVTAKVNLA